LATAYVLLLAVLGPILARAMGSLPSSQSKSPSTEER